MPEIILTALNARYIHTSYAIRSLYANMGSLRSQCHMKEFTIEQRAVDIAEELLSLNPTIIALGLYIWNIRLANELVPLLKKIAPQVKLLVGGPECFDENDLPQAARDADTVIAGEGEEILPEIFQKFLDGQAVPHFILAPQPDLARLELPYDYYSDEDLRQRVIYLESSRGCAQGCQYCTSSIDRRVRRFPREKIFPAWRTLLNRGARQLKFLDRSLHLADGPEILAFFLENYQPGLFLHFEINPDNISEKLWDMLHKFPAGTIQLEIGLQTLDDNVNRQIGRHQIGSRALENIMRLGDARLFHLHTDLIFGLPGEDIAAFGQSFDRLWAAKPEEIQIGHLKRLRGTPMARHPWDDSYRFAQEAPYELLANKWLSFAEVQQLRRLARLYDLVLNNGHFPNSVALLFQNSASPFNTFLKFCNWFYLHYGQPVSIARARLAEILSGYLTGELHCDDSMVSAAAHDDVLLIKQSKNKELPARQAAHRASAASNNKK